MGSRSTTFGRPVLHALLLPTLVACLGAGVLAGAGPAHAAPVVEPFAAMQSLRALLAVQQAQLTAADGAADDCFGYSVAIDGDTAVVGAPYDDVGANRRPGLGLRLHAQRHAPGASRPS